ncbi:hypothetical protein JKP88DRAFT_255485 [Tribonema minus]|uniref:Uncharacterized protein n=1 Tax=Tribonema minus TaxID=303371 RepID=A0A835YZK2_9STRA|nr:hypothetical protein JKP88DRAFT_255485 [Tribonema minus]
MAAAAAAAAELQLTAGALHTGPGTLLAGIATAVRTAPEDVVYVPLLNFKLNSESGLGAVMAAGPTPWLEVEASPTGVLGGMRWEATLHIAPETTTLSLVSNDPLPLPLHFSACGARDYFALSQLLYRPDAAGPGSCGFKVTVEDSANGAYGGDAGSQVPGGAGQELPLKFGDEKLSNFNSEYFLLEQEEFRSLQQRLKSEQQQQRVRGGRGRSGVGCNCGSDGHNSKSSSRMHAVADVGGSRCCRIVNSINSLAHNQLPP